MFVKGGILMRLNTMESTLQISLEINCNPWRPQAVTWKLATLVEI